MSRPDSARVCDKCGHGRGGLVAFNNGRRWLCGRCGAQETPAKRREPDTSMAWGEILRIERARKFPDARIFGTAIGVGATTVGAWEAGVEHPKGHEQHQRLRQHLPEMVRWDAKLLAEIDKAAMGASRESEPPPVVRLVQKGETMSAQPAKADPKRNLRYLTLLLRVGRLKAAPNVVALLELAAEDGASCSDLAEALTGAFVEIGE